MHSFTLSHLTILYGSTTIVRHYIYDANCTCMYMCMKLPSIYVCGGIFLSLKSQLMFLFLYSSYAVPASGVFLVPVEAIVLYNRTLQLNCTVSSRTYPNITWSTRTTTANITINNAAIVTTNKSDYMFSSVLTLNGVDLRYSGMYTCYSTNQGGSASDTSTVTVNCK